MTLYGFQALKTGKPKFLFFQKNINQVFGFKKFKVFEWGLLWWGFLEKVSHRESFFSA